MSRSLKSEACSGQRSLEVLSAVDQKHGGFDVVFLAEFTQENLCQGGRRRRKQPNVQQVVRLGVASSVQPILLVVDPNHSLVNRDVIRASTLCGL